MTTEIVIDGESLTFEQVISVAYGTPGEPSVVLSDNAKSNVNRCAAAVQTLLDRGEIAYGITTGFGAFKDKIISREEVETLQRNVVLSHAVGVGKPFDMPTVRAIMLIRANTLARGFSGIRLETMELIIECLNRGVHPLIPEKGSLGASGDLAPLAHFACVLVGEGEHVAIGEAVAHGGEHGEIARGGAQPVLRALQPHAAPLPGGAGEFLDDPNAVVAGAVIAPVQRPFLEGLVEQAFELGRQKALAVIRREQDRHSVFG